MDDMDDFVLAAEKGDLCIKVFAQSKSNQDEAVDRQTN